jgi:threonine dehydratase
MHADIHSSNRVADPALHRRTPVIEVDAADFGLAAAHLSFKLELLQHAGSFKTRGAFANLLIRGIPQAGVMAASGGNHGAAVAYASIRIGIPAKIFVPSISSPVKVQRIRHYRAERVVSGDRYDDALAASEVWAEQSGERSRSTPSISAKPCWAREQSGWRWSSKARVLTPSSSRLEATGFIAGIAAWFGGKVRVVGVEPEVSPTLTMALRAGEPVDAPAGGIAADPLAPRHVGTLVYPIAKRHVDHVVLVPDDAIHRAQIALWETLTKDLSENY